MTPDWLVKAVVRVLRNQTSVIVGDEVGVGGEMGAHWSKKSGATTNLMISPRRSRLPAAVQWSE